MVERKRELRAVALSRRASLSPSESCRLSRQIQERAVQWPRYRDCAAVALYRAVQNEVATDTLREHAMATGKQVFYPRTAREGTLEFVRVEADEPWTVGWGGVPEPTGSVRLTAAPDRFVVFVPGVAFDVRGGRLGRGKGGYDRFLAALGSQATVVGLAYEFQIVDEVPTETWDQRVDFIVTESRLICCRDRRQQLSLS
ncbi:MAG TPA: 5-formyltetrahydrofolate cyclo-ligase [candidate division Zixibacteria bacterium]|nr:5-formyltetrahydrofolate cyclo-ligase [candidate division Zixibacteria bacterium]